MGISAKNVADLLVKILSVTRTSFHSLCKVTSNKSKQTTAGYTRPKLSLGCLEISLNSGSDTISELPRNIAAEWYLYDMIYLST